MELKDFVLEELVKKEADNIKLYATPEEIAKLDERFVSGMSRRRCVYGLMTGDCNSQRAQDLIAKCADNVFVPTNEGGSYEKLNGHSSEVEVKNPENRAYSYMTPLEKYIYQYLSNSKARQVVRYIKGDTDSIVCP